MAIFSPQKKPKFKQSKKKRKADAIIIGGGLTGLIAATFLACRGFKIIVCEKNNAVGGMLANRYTIVNKKKYLAPSIISILPALEHPIIKNIWTFTKLNSVIKFTKPRQITILKNNSGEVLIPNNWISLQKKWKEKYPNNTVEINKFFDTLKKIYHDLSATFYYSEEKKYINGIEFLHNFLNNKELVKEIILLSKMFDFDIDNCNSRELLFNLSLYLIGGVYEIKGSISHIVTKLVSIAEAYECEFLLEKPAKEILWKNNTVTGVKIDGKILRAKKYLINAPLTQAVNELFTVKSFKISSYRKLLDDNENNKTTLIINYYAKENWRKAGLYKPNFLLNPSKSFIESHPILKIIVGELKTVRVVNHQLIEDEEEKKEFHNSKPLSVYIQTTTDVFKKFGPKNNEELAKKIFDYLSTIWESLKITQYTYIVEGLKYQKKYLNSSTGSDYGTMSKRVFWGNYVSITPLINLYVGSRYGYPGSGVVNAFFGGVFAANGMLIQITKARETLYKTDFLDDTNFLNYVLSNKRKIPKKIEGLKLGFTFDKENSFIVHFHKDELISVKKVEFDIALQQEYFCYSTLSNFKSLYSHRLSLFRATFQNKIRLKGKLVNFKLAMRTLGWNRPRKEYL